MQRSTSTSIVVSMISLEGLLLVVGEVLLITSGGPGG
jgi:hypothetical protein